MAVTSISDIKSSGIYREVIDERRYKTERQSAARLLVGFSRRGPFNRPLYFENVEEFERIYGRHMNCDEALGLYFNRCVVDALSKGPCYVLNAKVFDNSNRLDAVSLPLSSIHNNLYNGTVNLPVTSVYETTGYWEIIPRNFVEHAGYSRTENGPLNITTTYDNKNMGVTVFMRKYDSPDTFDNLTVKEYAKRMNAPQYAMELDDSDIVACTLFKDTLVEMYVFKGEFTREVVTSEELRAFFTVSGSNIYLNPTYTDSFGVVHDSLEALSNVPQSNFINVYRGTTLPEFVNAAGAPISIASLVNTDNLNNGLAMYTSVDDLNHLLPRYPQTFDYTNIGSIAYYLNYDLGIPTTGTTTYSGMEYHIQTPGRNIYTVEVDDTDIISIDNSGDHTIVTAANGTTTSDQMDALVSFISADNLGILSRNQSLPYVVVVSQCTVTVDSSNNLVYEFTEQGSVACNLDIVHDTNRHVYIFRMVHSLSVTYGSNSAYGGYRMRPFYMRGYDYQYVSARDTQVAKSNWIKDKSTNALITGGVFKDVTDRNVTPYRYIVDTFESFAVPGYCGSAIAKVVSRRDGIFGILNYPAERRFEEYRTSSTDTYQTLYNRSGMHLVTDIADGAERIAYYTPYLWRNPSVRTITATVPSAAVVSNRFMDKLIAAKIFDPVAGLQKGSVSCNGMVSPDFEYDSDERNFLEPLGVNVLVHDPRGNVYINSNRTGLPNAQGLRALASISELCIFLQDEIEDMLKEYSFEFNNDYTRERVTERATEILQNAKNNKAIFDFRVVCDNTNNTDALIDDEFLVLDCYIEPNIPAGKMLQRLYLRRTQTNVINSNQVVHPFLIH